MPDSKSPLEIEFDLEMIDVYQRAKTEARYDAKEFRRMVLQLGGKATAKRLLKSPRVQSGFERLWLEGRLDITMEARILKAKYADLFEISELTEARKRLEAANFDVRSIY